MLQWIYTGSYAVLAHCSVPDDRSALPKPEAGHEGEVLQKDSSAGLGSLFEVLVYTAGDKYMVEPLKQHALKAFQNACKESWSCPSLPPAILQVYGYASDRHDPLKKIIVATVMDHADELLRDDSQYVIFHAAMCANADFAAGVSVTLCKKQPEKVIVEKTVPDTSLCVFKCPNCYTRFAIGQTPTPNTHFSCPRDCSFSKNKSPSWWSTEKA